MAKHIVCAMSGGVDSSVAAWILKNKGYRVTGLFMRNWDVVDETGVCAADQDCEDAQHACEVLDIPFHQVNFVQDYWHSVFSEFLQQYQSGFTPNPDILCNKYIKFDKFLEHAIGRFGADAMATGHYAQTSVGERFLFERSATDKGVKLLKAEDSWKDQTFFLSQMPQSALTKTIFPLGHLTKDSVKQIAKAVGLDRSADRKESMGICFIGRRHFQRFIREYLELKPGHFISVEDDKIVGDHEGHFLYTVGQGANIGGMKERWFVVDKDAEANAVYVAPTTHHPALFHETFWTGPVHWIHRPPRELLEDQMMDCDFRFQHVHGLTKCTLTLSSLGSVIVSLCKPLRAITPGQYAVFYRDDECLGSGVIMKRGPSLYQLNWKKYQSGEWKPEFSGT
ncbi:mitochondrial tRNA-specific 2-thiouridylase 1-like [Diadema antillarum]|uniref:mitochondrial tRNA-specific 2-thiouridylase 1-like n=1 Tax=Diadema antillarum TaxID=105358 RepID=UPI003A8C0292